MRFGGEHSSSCLPTFKFLISNLPSSNSVRTEGYHKRGKASLQKQTLQLPGGRPAPSWAVSGSGYLAGLDVLALPLFSDLIQRIDVLHVSLVCNAGEGPGFRNPTGEQLADPPLRLRPMAVSSQGPTEL